MKNHSENRQHNSAADSYKSDFSHFAHAHKDKKIQNPKVKKDRFQTPW